MLTELHPHAVVRREAGSHAGKEVLEHHSVGLPKEVSLRAKARVLASGKVLWWSLVSYKLGHQWCPGCQKAPVVGHGGSPWLTPTHAPLHLCAPLHTRSLAKPRLQLSAGHQEKVAVLVEETHIHPQS
jgi:hypothetical protein